MAGAKKKRRALSRNELLARNPVWRAGLKGSLTGTKQTELALRARLAFDSIVSGRVSPGDPDELAVVSNICLLLCEKGIGAEYLERVKQAQEAILSAQRRENDGKAFNFTGPERAAVLDLLDLHEQHLMCASELQFIEALAEVEVRIRSGDYVHLQRTTATG